MLSGKFDLPTSLLSQESPEEAAIDQNAGIVIRLIFLVTISMNSKYFLRHKKGICELLVKHVLTCPNLACIQTLQKEKIASSRLCNCTYFLASRMPALL